MQLKRGDLPSLHKALCSSPNMQLEKTDTFTFIYNIENSIKVRCSGSCLKSESCKK